jgi:A/G-specific adenine glycosylase
MAALPGDDWNAVGPSPGAYPEIRHVFTHFELRMSIVPLTEPAGPGWWQPLESIDAAGLPTLFRKAVSEALRAHDRRAAA